MSIRVSKEFGNNFVLDEPELRRIHKVLTEQMALVTQNNAFTTTFNLKLKNQMAFSKTSLDDVLDESNGGEKAIQDLEILINDRSTRNEISLKFSKDVYASNNYEINGSDRNWVSITQSLIEERIKNLRQALVISGAARFLLWCSIFALAFIDILILGAPIYNSLIHSHPLGLIMVPIRGLIIFLLVTNLLAVGIFSYLYFFPPQNFCWGDYVKVYQRRQSIGKFIIVGVIVGLVISVLGSIIASYFMT